MQADGRSPSFACGSLRSHQWGGNGLTQVNPEIYSED